MKAFCSPYTTGLYKRDMKAEVTVASLRSVGTRWHSGRVVTHHWNSHAGAFLSDRVQSGFCNWRPFTREGFCLHADVNGSFCSAQTGCSGFHLPGVAGVISMGTVHLAVCVCVCHNKPPPGHLLCVSTHHDDQQNILEVVPETQCGAAEQGKVSLQELQDETERSLSVLLEHTNTHTHAHGAKKTLAGSTNMRDTKQAEVSDWKTQTWKVILYTNSFTVKYTECVWLFHVRTMKPSEVKRKAMTSLAYGPYPITSLIPWKKDMGSDLGREDSEKRKDTREWTKMQNSLWNVLMSRF